MSSMVFKLDSDNFIFPNPALADEDGLLAIGGDLSQERLMAAYERGIFPWFNVGKDIYWYSPHERCVIFPKDIVSSKSMQKILRQNIFTITTDKAFAEVIHHCKTVRRKNEEGTWISEDIEKAYIQLHKKGIAHSIEAWQNNELAGGMYGLGINKVFCGESMFHKVSNSSKAIVIWLCTQTNYTLLDCQVPNEHLMSLGATMISRKEYLDILHS